MKIKINKRGSREFYQEVINVSTQYNKLLRKPQARLTNSLKAWKSYIIFSLILLVLYIVEIVMWGASPLMWILMTIVAFIGVSSGIALFSYNKQLKAMLNDDIEAELTLDDEGVELYKSSITVKLSWDNVAFARTFKESTCFIPRTRTGMIIAVGREHYNEILPYIKSRVID